MLVGTADEDSIEALGERADLATANAEFDTQRNQALFASILHRENAMLRRAWAAMGAFLAEHVAHGDYEPDHPCGQVCYESKFFVPVVEDPPARGRPTLHMRLVPPLFLYACAKHGTFHRCGIGQCSATLAMPDGETHCLFSGRSVGRGGAPGEPQEDVRFDSGVSTENGRVRIDAEGESFLLVRGSDMSRAAAFEGGAFPPTVMNYGVVSYMARQTLAVRDARRAGGYDALLPRHLQSAPAPLSPPPRPKRQRDPSVPLDRAAVRPNEVNTIRAIARTLLYDREGRTACIRELLDRANAERTALLQERAAADSSVSVGGMSFPRMVRLPDMMAYLTAGAQPLRHLARYGLTYDGDLACLRGSLTPAFSDSMLEDVVRRVVEVWAEYRSIDETVPCSANVYASLTVYLLLSLGDGDIVRDAITVRSTPYLQQWLPTPEWAIHLGLFSAEERLFIDVREYRRGLGHFSAFHAALVASGRTLVVGQ